MITVGAAAVVPTRATKVIVLLSLVVPLFLASHASAHAPPSTAAWVFARPSSSSSRGKSARHAFERDRGDGGERDRAGTVVAGAAGRAFATIMASSLVVLGGFVFHPASSFASVEVAPEGWMSSSSRTARSSDTGAPPSLSSFLMSATPTQESEGSEFDRLGLAAPTEDRPQITFDGRIGRDGKLVGYGNADANGNGNGKKIDRRGADKNNVKSNRGPILRGLVFFPERPPGDPRRRDVETVDYFNDVLVLTASSASQTDGAILAGAKIPLSTVRFPFNFEMYETNLLLDRPGVGDLWYGKASDAGGGNGGGAGTTEDMFIKAAVCPGDAKTLPCGNAEAKATAAGVAKLIRNLPGLPEGATVRASASLPLE